MRKRKVTYPVARTSRRPAPTDTPEVTYVRPSVVAIDVNAQSGREGITIGRRVRIIGGGLYSGEIAVVESMPGGLIPSALVRTEAGRTRRVRTIDLEPVGDNVTTERPAEKGPDAAIPDAAIEAKAAEPKAERADA